MSPREAVERHYADQRASFSVQYSACEQWGFVAETDHYFLMAVPIVILETCRHRGVTNVMRAVRHGQADAWFIAGMSGDMQAAWESEPYRLPWFAFERGKNLHVWPRDRIRALTCRHPVASL